MPFFTNYPTVQYKFGEEIYTVDYPDLVRYSQILDQIKNNGAFYQKYYIKEGSRPDNVSFELYDNPMYHWTFFFLNDTLRESGWPLDQYSLDQIIAHQFRNTVLVTRDNIFEKFPEGSTVTGQTSEAEGVVIKKNENFGQIFIQRAQPFLDGEDIIAEVDGETQTATIVSVLAEKDAAIYYTNGTNVVDIDPFLGPGEGITPVTFEDYYNTRNGNLRDIVILKPEVMGTFISEFHSAMRS